MSFITAWLALMVSCCQTQREKCTKKCSFDCENCGAWPAALAETGNYCIKTEAPVRPLRSIPTPPPAHPLDQPAEQHPAVTLQTNRGWNLRWQEGGGWGRSTSTCPPASCTDPDESRHHGALTARTQQDTTGEIIRPRGGGHYGYSCFCSRQGCSRGLDCFHFLCMMNLTQATRCWHISSETHHLGLKYWGEVKMLTGARRERCVTAACQCRCMSFKSEQISQNPSTVRNSLCSVSLLTLLRSRCLSKIILIVSFIWSKLSCVSYDWYRK